MSALTGRRVLVVDQDCGDLACCAEVLGERGCQVQVCSSCGEGVQHLEREWFDFIVVCQGGPEFEGRAVLERAMAIDRRIPVLVVTRCLDIQCYLEAMQLGAFDYVEKPLVPAEIAHLVETHVRPHAMAQGVA